MIKDVVNQLDKDLDKVIDSLREELNQIRAGRANLALVEKIMVDYHGVATPLQQIASISVPEARLLVIQPWDTSVVGEVEKAILKSDLGITPSNDGKIIRLPFPELTEDRRKELIKDCKSIAEEYKVSVRNSRKEAMDELKRLEKEESMGEDEKALGEEQVQESVDKCNDKIDEILENKEKELLNF